MKRRRGEGSVDDRVRDGRVCDSCRPRQQPQFATPRNIQECRRRGALWTLPSSSRRVSRSFVVVLIHALYYSLLLSSQGLAWSPASSQHRPSFVRPPDLAGPTSRNDPPRGPFQSSRSHRSTRFRISVSSCTTLQASRSSSFTENIDGLSKFHQSILSRTYDRQRFVTGRYPLIVTVVENPTRKWLSMGNRNDMAETEILVNGTSPLRSLASFDRFQWLDDDERSELAEKYSMVSLELIAEIHTERPGYLQILSCDGAGSTAALNTGEQGWTSRWKRPASILQNLEDMTVRYRDRLWISGFSLAGRKGILKSIESSGIMTSVTPRTGKTLLWPNEVQAVPVSLIRQANPGSNNTRAAIPQETQQDALLVSDGFLVPGKDRGGLYIVKNPGSATSEWTVSLSRQCSSSRWFYHRAVWVDLTGDGRLSILTARCRLSTALGNNDVTAGITKTGQLVWLECPRPFSIDPDSGTPLEKDGTVFDPFSARHTPWKEHVLASGPDVMFCVADLDDRDDTIEVISSQFFTRHVRLYSIERGPSPRVTFDRVIDEHSGAAFGCILADLDGQGSTSSAGPRVIDSGSTVSTAIAGDSFSHLLVTSHECTYAGKDTRDNTESYHDANGATDKPDIDGGSLFAYRIPTGKRAWRTKPWIRSTLASGFKVNGQLSNVINPGAPGFVYTFPAKKSDRKVPPNSPLIAVAGDCAESAYIFRPVRPGQRRSSLSNGVEEPRYSLMVEVQCSATVGSIGIGYDEFAEADQETGYAKLYIPCYEKDKVLVFALGSGEDDSGEW